MKKIQWAIAASTFCLSVSATAQTDTSSKAPPTYGDNPNLLKVLTVKAQEKVQSAAEKVGAVAEKGVAKIKPGVDETWQNTKEYTTEQAVIARDHARQGIDTAVKKVQETKNTILGPQQGGIPIERGTLSQPAQPSMSHSPAQGISTASQIQPTLPAPTAVPPHATTATADISASNQNATEFDPAEIQRQSLPIQSSSATTPVNVDTPTTSSNDQNNTSRTTEANLSNSSSEPEDESGLVR